MLTMKTETSTPCRSTIVEFHELQGEKLTVYRFEYPVSNLLAKTIQRIDHGKSPGKYLEHGRRAMTADDEAKLTDLEAKAKEQPILKRIRQEVGVRLVETVYFAPKSHTDAQSVHTPMSG